MTLLVLLSSAALADETSKPEEAAAPPEEAAATPEPVEFAGAHILIQYQGSMRAPETITRSKEEARELCASLAERARAGEDFAELAKEYSDGPSGPRGGDLGSWQKGRMIPEFDEAIEHLEIGGISDPVETGFGFHVILRKKVDMVACRHILVMYQGSERAPAEITRTKEEAMERAEEVLAKVQAGGSFEDLAAEYSDGPTKTQGGDLGRFGRGMMHPAFEEAAFGLEIDAASGIVETPFGFHVIQRYQ